jgi:UDP-glucose 4-epimerase
MRILVCGGAGYIGSHTVKALLREGYEVVIFDNFSSGKEELVKGGDVIRGDLDDKETIRKVFSSRKIDAVLHFASLIQVGESYVNPTSRRSSSPRAPRSMGLPRKSRSPNPTL